MPRLSLTDFVDVVSASGTPKATKVRQVKARPPYNPVQDFWKRLRDRVVETHQAGLGKTHLDGVLSALSDKKKLTAYPPAVAGYKRWWGTKKLTWFAPPAAVHSGHGVDVSVNPELGLEINGIPHLVKLYFKEEGLTKNRIDIITHLMAEELATRSPAGAVMGVLDVQRGRLIVPTVAVPGLKAIVDAELAYIAALWAKV
jgi:hypothetical protein